MRQAIEKQAVETFGKEHQLIKTVEELGELTAAIARYILMIMFTPKIPEKKKHELLENFCEETADVKIMLEQIKQFILDELSVERKELEKLDRLDRILKAERLKNEL